MDSDTTEQRLMDSVPSLPAGAYQSFNHCNLPAYLLGSITFQEHPAPLILDGVAELYVDLFQRLDSIAECHRRKEIFADYMSVHFRLYDPEEMGFTSDSQHNRVKADYRRILRGWQFDPDNREGAIIKGWVESRFGLLPRWHRGPIRDPLNPTYDVYLRERTSGIYNTNALESQLDLVYSFCQYELRRQYPQEQSFTLYRGINSIDRFTNLTPENKKNPVLLLNSLNSFSQSLERAGEFGDTVLEVKIPLPKIVFNSGFLPCFPKSEDEYAVLGGIYRVSLTS